MEYKNLKQTFLTLGLVRVLTVLSNFLITGLLLRILDVDSYGVYTAMFSLLSWMFLFDIGISKGMRNHLTKSLVDNDLILAKKIISTSYITTFVITSFFLLLIFFFTKDADIASYLNISKYSNVEIYSIFIVFVLIMLCKLFLGTIDQILYAHHKSSLNSINSLIINLLFALALLISLKLSLNNIFYISIFYGFSVLSSYLIFTIYFFNKNRALIPSFKFYSKKIIKMIMGDGLSILSIQLLFFAFLGMDRFILLKYGSGLEVTNYDIMYRVMSLLLFPWSIIAQPLWSSYAEAYKRKDIIWIKKIYNRLLIVFCFTIFGVFLLSFSFDFITTLWLGKILEVDMQMLLLTGFLILLIMWSTMHSDILFGLSKFRISLIAAILGFSLKIIFLYFALNNNFDISKLLISSISAYAIFCVIAPISVFKLLKD